MILKESLHFPGRLHAAHIQGRIGGGGEIPIFCQRKGVGISLPVFQHSDPYRYFSRHFQSADHRLPVPLDAVEVAHGQKGPRHIHRQIQNSPFVHIPDIQIATMLTGNGGRHAALRRGHTDDADHGTQGHPDALVKDHFLPFHREAAAMAAR